MVRLRSDSVRMAASGSPFVVTWDPRQWLETSDKSANSVIALAIGYAESAARSVDTPADRVLVAHGLEHKVVIEQANSREALLDRRVGQAALHSLRLPRHLGVRRGPLP